VPPCGGWVSSTRTSNEVGRNRHRPRFFLADVRREGTLRAGLPELALKVEMGGPPNRIAHYAANSLLLAHDRKHLTRGGAYARLGRQTSVLAIRTTRAGWFSLKPAAEKIHCQATVGRPWFASYALYAEQDAPRPRPCGPLHPRGCGPKHILHSQRQACPPARRYSRRGATRAANAWTSCCTLISAWAVPPGGDAGGRPH